VSVPINKIFSGPVSATGFGEEITSKALMFPAKFRAAKPKIPATEAMSRITPEVMATIRRKRLTAFFPSDYVSFAPLLNIVTKIHTCQGVFLMNTTY
jgi:hypothetical protein